MSMNLIHSLYLAGYISQLQPILATGTKPNNWSNPGNPFTDELQRHYDTGVAQTFQFLKTAEYTKVLESTSPMDQSGATKDKTLKKSRKGQKK